MGTKLAQVLAPLTYPADPLPYSNAENANALPNPMMVGAGPTATNVTVAVNSGAGVATPSVVPRTDMQGQWQQLVIASSTDFTRVQQQTATNVGAGIANVGQAVYATAEVTIAPGATMVAANGEVPVGLSLINQDAAGAPTINDMSTSSGYGTYPGIVPSGRLILRTPNYVLPAGSSRLYCRVLFYLNGTVQVGRMQVYQAQTLNPYDD
jgi:hypothetical protein